MAAQPPIRLSAEQEKFVEKIEPGTGVIFPRRHGATTALAHYVRTHPKEFTAFVAPTKRLARKFEEDTEHAVEVYDEVYTKPRGVFGSVLIDGCRSIDVLGMVLQAFTVFDPQFTVPQARKLWFKDTKARVVVTYDRCQGAKLGGLAEGVRFNDNSIWWYKDFIIGDDIDALILVIRTELEAWADVLGRSDEDVFIQEAVYLEGEDLMRVARIQLE